jgi:hypothetical protein
MGNGCKLVEVLSRNFAAGSGENLGKLSKQADFPNKILTRFSQVWV